MELYSFLYYNVLIFYYLIKLKYNNNFNLINKLMVLICLIGTPVVTNGGATCNNTISSCL